MLVSFQQANQIGIRTLGTGGGATDPGTDVRAEAWETLVSLAADGKIDVAVATSFPLADAATAHKLVRTRHAGGKVVLVP